jgi:DNA invertase Pin-like site-specific DNA recombinase
MKRIVGYVRVSTEKQRRKGWGVKAQKSAIRKYAARHGARLLFIYVERDHGDNAERPKLASAIAHARRSRALLVVSRLDRLTRCYHILRDIEQSGVRFRALDNPHADRTTIHLMAIMAERELQLIRERTKDGIREYRLENPNKQWGNPQNLTPAAIRKGQLASARARSTRAVAAYADLYPRLRELRESMTLAEIAQRLNREGQRTTRANRWTTSSLWPVLQRANLAG